MAKRNIYQGEAKVLPFRVKDKRTGRALDLTGATFLLWVKRSPEDAEAVFSKADTDFDKSAVAAGYVTVFLTAYDTYRKPWVYQAELRIIKPGEPVPVEKIPFELEILRAITPNDWVLTMTGIPGGAALGTPLITS